MRGVGAITAAVLAISACNQPGSQPSSNAGQPVNASGIETPPPIPPPGTGPDARTPLGEPKKAIDPKSIEAAGQVVQHYGALIEQKRWSEAAGLWDNRSAADDFAEALKADRDLHLEIGELGSSEGAAGSIYLVIPVMFYGDDQGGTSFRRSAEITLRRVNDVPGSTEAQRRWHIERIDWGAAG